MELANVEVPQAKKWPAWAEYGLAVVVMPVIYIIGACCYPFVRLPIWWNKRHL